MLIIDRTYLQLMMIVVLHDNAVDSVFFPATKISKLAFYRLIFNLFYAFFFFLIDQIYRLAFNMPILVFISGKMNFTQCSLFFVV